MKQKTSTPNGGLITGRQIPVAELPVRSKPFEHLLEFKTACATLQPGHAVEVDSERVDEHRARKYLELLSKTDPRFKLLVLRTGTNHSGERRRVFIVRPVNIPLAGNTSEDTFKL
jgi:hypothetical protein